MASARPAVVVGHHKAFQAGGGGVQTCNREFMACLAAAGFDIQTVTFDFQRRVADPILGRVFPRVVRARMPDDLFRRVDDAVRRTGASEIFFSFNLDPKLSKRLREAFPNARQILLSYGIESIDFLHSQLIQPRRSRLVGARMLGTQLLDEAAERRFIDAVLTLSPLDAEMEAWLGTRNVLWLPRTVQVSALSPRPVEGRAGCVATLDHPPNLDGFERLFEAIASSAPPHFRFRLVGHPHGLGSEIARRYAFVEYLGPLPDDGLRAEAETWSCFAHPLFVYAKGCSTKLALALGWQLPIATTRFGARGYLWDEAVLPLASTPGELAHAVIQRSTLDRFAAHRDETLRIADMAPSIQEIGGRIREFLAARGGPR